MMKSSPSACTNTVEETTTNSKALSSAPFPQPLLLCDDIEELTDRLKHFRIEWTAYAHDNAVFDKPAERQTATLLAALGADTAEVYHDLEPTLSKGDRLNAKALLASIERHLLGDNKRQCRVNFSKQARYAGEPCWRFLDRLEQKIDGCKYGELRDDVLLDKIIASINNEPISLELCAMQGVTLAKAKARCLLEDRKNCDEKPKKRPPQQPNKGNKPTTQKVNVQPSKAKAPPPAQTQQSKTTTAHHASSAKSSTAPHKTTTVAASSAKSTGAIPKVTKNTSNNNNNNEFTGKMLCYQCGDLERGLDHLECPILCPAYNHQCRICGEHNHSEFVCKRKTKYVV